MIRDFHTEDTDAVVKIWRAASDLAHPFLDTAFQDNEAGNLRNIYLVHAKTRVLEIDGDIAGFIAMIGDEIGGLFLEPAMHGCGYGWALVSDILHGRSEVLVDVFERNAIGRRFYAAAGFEMIGQSVHDASGETVLRLRRDRVLDMQEAVA